MKFPRLQAAAVETGTYTAFGGYRHTPDAGGAQFYEMENLSGRAYPAVSPRPQRGKITALQKPNGLFAKSGICWVDGTKFYHNGVYRGEVSDGKKQFASMGAYVLIFPDKKYYHTVSQEFGSLEASFTTTGQAALTFSDAAGTQYTGQTISAAAPANPSDGDFWADTGSTPNTLRVYSAQNAEWQAVATSHVKISAAGIGALFSAYEGVTISGCKNAAFNGEFVLTACSENAIVVAGVLEKVTAQTDPLTITRTVPDLDFVTESANRLWGCASSTRRIYASQLGNPKSWNAFSGLSTDSYALTVGSDGDFTGVASHLGSVLFFKEDRIHKVYGTKPANYQVTDLCAPGVGKGSEKSLAAVESTLFYQGRDGVYAYEGAMPYRVSEDLGAVRYHSGVGGASGGRYYLSVCAEASFDPYGISGSRKAAGTHLFVYDKRTSLWHREDAVRALGFAYTHGELYFLDADGNLWNTEGNLSLFEGGTAYCDSSVLESPVAWSAETGDLCSGLTERRYLERLQLTAAMEPGATLSVAVSCDSGAWETAASLESNTLRTVAIPLLPKRCRLLRLRISGTGTVRLLALSRQLGEGSERG